MDTSVTLPRHQLPMSSGEQLQNPKVTKPEDDTVSEAAAQKWIDDVAKTAE
jgi:hypothetical protein